MSRIGRIEGPPEYLLSRLPVFTVGLDGSLFVADLRGDLRHYDAEGTYVRTIARQGQGPGEVTYVVSMDVSTDGELAALDFSNRRVSVFSPDGTLVREIRLRPSAGRPGYGRDALRWDERGRLWISLNPPRRGLDTLRAGQRRPLFGRLIGHEEVTDTVFLPTRAWEGCERRSPGHSGGSMEDNRLRHMPFAQWTRSRAGVLAFGCSASYAIDVVRSDGGVTRMSRAWDPPVRTDEEHDPRSAAALVQALRQCDEVAQFLISKERAVAREAALGVPISRQTLAPITAALAAGLPANVAAELLDKIRRTHPSMVPYAVDCLLKCDPNEDLVRAF
ncbi:MAG: 6-bladed beta-propeller, partial [Gammaproteobacteria bacterium]|nr:6-bladed beta-propeller [Gammaproteobacteria bacterium]